MYVHLYIVLTGFSTKLPKNRTLSQVHTVVQHVYLTNMNRCVSGVYIIHVHMFISGAREVVAYEKIILEFFTALYGVYPGTNPGTVSWISSEIYEISRSISPLSSVLNYMYPGSLICSNLHVFVLQ